jgi:hypothetical protein
MTTVKTMFDYAPLLTTLQAIAPEAHIAGGAVRDTILEKPIRDIDVFMKAHYLEEAAACLRSSCGYVKVGEWETYLEFSDPAIARVAKFEKADETIPICLIGLHHDYSECMEPRGNIERFDFGICMAAFDGRTTIQNDAFDSDIESQTFTLLRADNEAQFAYSMRRFEKITADRYRGWTLAIPEEFEELAKEHTLHRHFYRDDLVKGIDGKSLLKLKERPALRLV